MKNLLKIFLFIGISTIANTGGLYNGIYSVDGDNWYLCINQVIQL